MAGVCIGAIVGYFVFIYMFGELQQKWIEEKLAMQGELQDLQHSYDTLLKNHQQLDQETKDGIQIQELEIEFLNLEELNIDNDRPMVQQLEQVLRTEASNAIGKSVDDLSSSIDLLISTIENKVINIDDFRFQATVSRIIVGETLRLSIELEKAN
ncbi:hypothetical protein MUN88_13855 [Gracilibacillus caseinilyticus]|uniref:Sporulation membrane protein YtrI C-terminal domain-containing protein n=1 Tax=Gracilibacillus caseinilyticus TaxID=2932256 RepID=A0ABY4ETF4_9BACI|nr:sporulation membrane protein YtrI [Gracilibacillus caseinilyticus]UOQ47157.1 hypothetical protein MUN88_13855 [Gracilibacillus caseinilyticus]